MGFIDSIEEFLGDACDVERDATVTENELADAYGAFCVARDASPAPLGFFLRVLEKSHREIRREGPKFIGLYLRLDPSSATLEALAGDEPGAPALDGQLNPSAQPLGRSADRALAAV